VRLQEANAGELAISEIINAIAQVAAPASRYLAWWAVGPEPSAAAASSRLLQPHRRLRARADKRQRAEVIETNKGVEELTPRIAPCLARLRRRTAISLEARTGM